MSFIVECIRTCSACQLTALLWYCCQYCCNLYHYYRLMRRVLQLQLPLLLPATSMIVNSATVERVTPEQSSLLLLKLLCTAGVCTVGALEWQEHPCICCRPRVCAKLTADDQWPHWAATTAEWEWSDCTHGQERHWHWRYYRWAHQKDTGVLAMHADTVFLYMQTHCNSHAKLHVQFANRCSIERLLRVLHSSSVWYLSMSLNCKLQSYIVHAACLHNMHTSVAHCTLFILAAVSLQRPLWAHHYRVHMLYHMLWYTAAQLAAVSTCTGAWLCRAYAWQQVQTSSAWSSTSRWIWCTRAKTCTTRAATSSRSRL
jgi:hypothetical protein